MNVHFCRTLNLSFVQFVYLELFLLTFAISHFFFFFKHRRQHPILRTSFLLFILHFSVCLICIFVFFIQSFLVFKVPYEELTLLSRCLNISIFLYVLELFYHQQTYESCYASLFFYWFSFKFYSNSYFLFKWLAIKSCLHWKVNFSIGFFFYFGKNDDLEVWLAYLNFLFIL